MKDILENNAPDDIKDVEGGIERSCTLLIVFNMIILASYVCEWS